MESDINTTSTTTSSTRESMPYTGTDTMAGERGFADYATDFGSSLATGTGRAVTFLADRPLLTGSIAVGAIGAFLGSRLGHMFAMRRRKSLYERAIDNFGPSLAV